MFCTKCGAQLNAGDAFCSACGQPLCEKINQSSQVREYSLGVLDKAQNAANLVLNLYNELEQNKRIIANTPTRSNRLALLLIFTPLGLISLLVFMSSKYYMFNAENVSFLLFAFGLLALGILPFTLGKIKAKKGRERIKKAREDNVEIYNAIVTAYKNSGIQKDYPLSYFHPESIAYCKNLIIEMRADSIKDAINFFEAENIGNYQKSRHAKKLSLE